MDLIEQFVRRYARRTTQNGAVVIITNGDQLLQDAFTALGWTDPYPDPELLPTPLPSAFVAATVIAPERAVIARQKGRVFR